MNRSELLSRLNPLRLGGRSLPPELVLIARFLGLTTLLLDPAPFPRHLPYLQVLDKLGSPGEFDMVLRLAAGVGLVLVFFGPFLRTGCLLVGAATLLGLVACRPCQSVAHTYAACVFLVLALSSPVTGPWFVRLQLVVVYAGAGLNKALDPDWWNGHYLDTLMITRHHHGLYTSVAESLPPFMLSSILGTLTILSEVVLAVCFLRRRWYGAGIVVGLCFHSFMVLLIGVTFGPFYAAIVISFLAFLDWPRRIEISLGEGAFARTLGRLLTTVDFDRTWTVHETPVPPGAGRLVVVVDGREYRGLGAVRRVLFACPLVFACFAVVLATPWPHYPLRDAVILGAMFICLAPLLPTLVAVPARPSRS